MARTPLKKETKEKRKQPSRNIRNDFLDWLEDERGRATDRKFSVRVDLIEESFPGVIEMFRRSA